MKENPFLFMASFMARVSCFTWYTVQRATYTAPQASAR